MGRQAVIQWVTIFPLKPSFKLEMWANAQRDGLPAEYIGGALCSTRQSLADAHY